MAERKKTEAEPAEPEVPPAPESSELGAAWNDLKEALDLPRVSDEKLRQFVDDFVSNRIFTTAHLHDHEVDLVPMIFMPISLGCFSKVQPDSLKNIGVIWEYLDKAGPRSINGKPIFFTFNMLHIEDWKRAIPAIQKEEERRKSIEL
jgi:hypothetical protein